MAPQKQVKLASPTSDTQTPENEYSVVPEGLSEAELVGIAQLAIEASTSNPERVSGAVDTGEVIGLSLPEVLGRYEIGASTLRNWLKEGKLPGAVRVPTSKGLAYRIPEAALTDRGVKLREGAGNGVELSKAKLRIETLEAAAKDTEQKLAAALAAVEIANAQRDLEAKVRETLEVGQADLRRALLMLESSAQKKKKWWKS